jgi:hypothetical protein
VFDTEEDAKQSLLDLKFKKRVFQGALVKVAFYVSPKKFGHLLTQNRRE